MVDIQAEKSLLTPYSNSPLLPLLLVALSLEKNVPDAETRFKCEYDFIIRPLSTLSGVEPVGFISKNGTTLQSEPVTYDTIHLKHSFGIPIHPKREEERGLPVDPSPPGYEVIESVKGDKGELVLIGLTVAKGEKGYKGDRGPTGRKGNIGFGFQGLKGEEGDRGPTGRKGNIGFGFQGLKGEEGYKGDRGPTGQKGNIGFGFQGLKGEEGYKGDRGPTGQKGNIGFGFQGL